MRSTDQSEEWRPVVGYEGLYEVSDRGRVWSVPRFRYYRGGSPRRIGGKILKNRIGPTGYPQVELYRDFKRKVGKVHRLVAEAFIPNPEGYPFVLHWDDNPENNHISNLRWGTPSENMHDIVRNGNHSGKNKSHCPYGHRLIEPNLIPSKLKAGYRICLSCKRARSNAARDNRPFTKERADVFYRRIMEEVNGGVRYSLNGQD